MKKIVIMLLVILTIFVFIIFSRNKEEKVLGLVSPTVIITPPFVPSESPSPVASQSALASASVSATLAATPSASVKIIVTPSPTKIEPTPTITSSKEINEYVDRFATQYGVDPNVLRYVALCESGFRSNAINGPYVGLYQYGSITWMNIRKEMNEDTNPDLRYSAEESVQTTAFALSKGKGKIWPNCMP